YATVTTVDISVDALTVAMDNAQRHHVEGHVRFVEADMLKYLKATKDKFDLIISNPPYIPTEQLQTLPKDVQQEPVLALDGGKDGLKFYKGIISASPSLLTRKGCLMMECGENQAERVKQLAEKEFPNVEAHKDLAGRPRVIICDME